MKCHVTTQHVANIPGYKKLYLNFSDPHNGLERILVAVLDFKKPHYIGGNEPKYSLYVGKPQERIIEGSVARQFTPSLKKFSWQRFWNDLRTQNPAYQFECRCGVWNRSDKLYKRHKKHCSILKDFKTMLARIESSKIYQEWLEDESKATRKAKKKPTTSTKRRSNRRKETVETVAKEVAKRSLNKRK